MKPNTTSFADKVNQIITDVCEEHKGKPFPSRDIPLASISRQVNDSLRELLGDVLSKFPEYPGSKNNLLISFSYENKETNSLLASYTKELKEFIKWMDDDYRGDSMCDVGLETFSLMQYRKDLSPQQEERVRQDYYNLNRSIILKEMSDYFFKEHVQARMYYLKDGNTLNLSKNSEFDMLSLIEIEQILVDFALAKMKMNYFTFFRPDTVDKLTVKISKGGESIVDVPGVGTMYITNEFSPLMQKLMDGTLDIEVKESTASLDVQIDLVNQHLRSEFNKHFEVKK